MNIQAVYNSADKICALVQEAGDALLKLYQKPGLKIDYKEDGSPVTEADFTSNDIIVRGLQLMFPEIAMVSEESSRKANIESAESGLFWSLDPLDGTKNFISGKEFFTTNLALIKDGTPVFGVLNIPLKDRLYCGFDKTTFKMVKKKKTMLSALSNQDISHVVISKRCDRKVLNKVVGILSPNAEVHYYSSAYKYGLLVEGQMDLFACCNYTYEWDSAAGHAIVRSIGGKAVTLDGKELEYGNVNHDFSNQYFLVLRDKAMISQNKLRAMIDIL